MPNHPGVLPPTLPIGVLVGGWLALASLASAASLPPGFSETIAFADVAGVTSIAWSPTGEAWAVGKDGPVWVWRRNVRTKIAQIPANTEGERGVTAIAIDPDYLANAQVWIYYTATLPSPHNRLSRFRDDGTQLVEETVVVEGPALKNVIHNGGGLRFALDKTLFLSLGDDDQRSVTAQDPHDLRGKVLHLNRDGSPAADNPFADGRAGHPLVWALGLRNPFRLSVQPGSGALFIGDVGADQWEELDAGIAGGNYGWDHIEGPEPPVQPGYVYPLYSYAHDNPVGNSIVAGGFAPAGNFPDAYTGNYFFADEPTGRLYRMILDGSNRPLSTELWATDLGNPVAVEFGPDGALYLADYTGAQVRRLSYRGGADRQPVAAAVVKPDNGAALLTVDFDGSGSYDPDGGALAYLWDFGDGSAGQGPTLTHTYLPGAYQARLTVTNPEGVAASSTGLAVTSGNHRPVAHILAPANEGSYVPDQMVRFRGEARDSEEGLLDCGRFEWRVVLHHLPPGSTTGHTHPWLGPLEGVCEGTFLAAHHEDDNVYYEVVLTVRDNGRPLGDDAVLAGRASTVIRPMKSQSRARARIGG